MISKEDYLRKDDEGMSSGGESGCRKNREEERKRVRKGLKCREGSSTLALGCYVMNLRCECVLCSGSSSEGVFLPEC